MLKPAVAALLLANLGTVLYTQGGLRWLGLGALDEREPQRLAQQLHPEQLQLLSATPATPAPPPVATPTPTTTSAPAPTAAPAAVPVPAVAPAVPPVQALAVPATPPTPTPTPAAPEKPPAPEKTPKADKATATEKPEKTEAKPDKPKAEKTQKTADKDKEPVKTAKRRGKTSCWQASGYTPVQTIVLNGALDRVPELDKRWKISATTTSGSSGRWLVYQGGFASTEALKQQRAEYKLANIDHRPVQLPGESGPGLVLGTYSSEAGAQRALQNAQRDGVHNARVLPEKGGNTRSYTLTLKAITEEEKALVEGLGSALAGKTLQRCP